MIKALGIGFMVMFLCADWTAGGEITQPGPFLQPLELKGNTPTLWLEADNVGLDWQGAELTRIIDEQTGGSCLEWYQNPATKATASLALKGINPEKYDAVRVQWKYLGGGSSLTFHIGSRNWYLYKESYRPGEWHDMWLDLNLNDDGGGPLLNEKGEFVIKLNFSVAPLGRSSEEPWRRIRVRNIRLVKFPVRLECDPKNVQVTHNKETLSTIFPLRLKNTTDKPQTIILSLDPQELNDFAASFEQKEITLPPKNEQTIKLTFSISADKAKKRPPLYFEEAPVYAMVKGEPESLTTWYRAFVQWKPGGVVPPENLKRPFMLKKGIREEVWARSGQYPWAKQMVDNWIKWAQEVLEKPLIIPEIRHGYGMNVVCPEHQVDLRIDPVNLRHYCEKGKHYVVGNPAIDKAALLSVHTRNSVDCRLLGWGYYLTGEEKYARKAADILLGYSEKYPDWDYANSGAVGYWSRVTHAVLGECWWIRGLVEGYDFIAGSPSLTEQEKNTIAHRLFAVAAEDIQSHRIMMGQQAAINEASGSAAINAQNWYLAARAFTGTYGLMDWLGLTFSEEGFSGENEFPYHFGSVQNMVNQGLVYEAIGGTFFTPEAKKPFDAPLFLSFDQKSLGGYAAFYEVAYSRYRDPAYLPVLKAFRAGQGDKYTLLEGVLPLPEDKKNDELSSNSLEKAGKTMLRKGTSEDLRAIQIHWGAPTWRGGRDFLNFLTYFKGVQLNSGVTRIAYGFKVDALSYETIGGNVPEVDGLTQTGVRPRQAVFLDGEFPTAKYLAPRSAAVYPGVELSRVISIIGGAYVIIDRLQSDKPRRYSFVFYPAGGTNLSFSGTDEFKTYEKFREEGAVYKAVKSPARATFPGRFTLDYKSAGSGKAFPTRAHFILDGKGEIVKGETLTGWSPPFLTPVVFARRLADAAACVLVLEAGEKELPLKDVQVLPVVVDGKQIPFSDGLAVVLKTADSSYLLLDCDRPGKKKAANIETEESIWVGKMK